ncbi:hypothetical protein DKX38_026484 [Salix brachista]|uniref:Uncharacterized protein n=1 Tax=Salix brachista TaxID=2182728 RepID=A0A5N5JBK6_9ROSI|nr:hypothetical protein DKX38_026484 [Salix brachista]
MERFNLGLSKNFCINLLEEDPNDISCHCPATDSFDGAAQYALYKRLASALYHSVKFGDLCRIYVKMMFGEDSNLKLKNENWNQLIKEKGLELINNWAGRYDSCKQNCVVLKVEMLQAESLKKVLPGVKTVEEGKPSSVLEFMLCCRNNVLS